MQLMNHLPQESVIAGLGILGEVLTRTNLKSRKGKFAGAWAWGLLARCREVGQMGSEEVGVLRDLGKQAVWLLRRIRAGEVVDEEGQEQDLDGEDPVEAGEDEIEDEGDAEVGEMLDSQGDVEIPTEIIANGTATDGSLLAAKSTSLSCDSDELLAAAQNRLLSSLGPTDESSAPAVSDEMVEEHAQMQEGEGVVDQATILATLDMIVTIVGEFYGQRDLLDGRLLWDELPD